MKSGGSVIDAVGIAALLALVENSGSLVHATGLDYVVFHFGVVAFGASLLDDHFALAATFAEATACLVLVKPLLVLPHLQLSPHYLSCLSTRVPANSLKLTLEPHS